MVKVLDVRTGLPHQNPTTSRKSSDFDAVALLMSFVCSVMCVDFSTFAKVLEC